ncbi:MAG: NAD(P)-dependent oxidoreductase [Caldilineaceae bacterium]|nr:NAD(P)-dependent oxidoreductase [Caldilineaceae bacterium]
MGYMTYARLRDQPEKYEAFALDVKREPSVRVPSAWTLEIPDERFHLCSLTDYAALRAAVEGMDVVVHLAADPEGREWQSVLDNNIIGAYHLFEACREAGVARIVAASSIMVSEGHREQEPYRAMMERRFDDIPDERPLISPALPAEPRGIYGASKVWMESLARVYAPSPRPFLPLRAHRPGRARPASPAPRSGHLRQPA